MKTPCEKCPFRTDIKGYLRPERVREICESVLLGQSFPCHQTTEEDDDGEDLVATEDSQECAGAAIFLAKQGASSQLSRIAERLGMKVAKLNMKAPVCKSASEMLAVHGGDEDEGEPCSVCDDGCEAPAGWQVGNGVIPGDGSAEFCCCECSDPVCGNCSRPAKGKRGKRICNNCLEGEA